MTDLHDVIEDSISDMELPLETEPEVTDESLHEVAEPTTTDTEAEAAPEAAPEADAEPEAEEAPQDGIAVESPASKKPVAEDDFAKKYGLQGQSASGRENRIPYSRVKKITEKAVKDAVEARNKQVETEFIPTTKYQELEAKNKDYEGRLTKVSEFEWVMQNDPENFVRMLTQIPAYAQLFQPLFQQSPQNAPQGTPEAAGTTQAAPVGDAMPEPDQTLTDGSRVYSMDGLKALLAWNAKQTEDRVTKVVSDKYGSMAEQYEQFQAVQAVMPRVNAQIAEARTWPKFTENEAEITNVLKQYPKASLADAYRYVVTPKLVEAGNAAQVDRGKLEQELRAKILAELKTAPRATSTAASPAKAVPVAVPGQKRDLTDVIQQAIQGLK